MATKTRKARKPMTDAEREAAKVARATKVAALEAAAEAFDLDEASVATTRAFGALTEHYSEGNALLILAQAAQLGLKVVPADDEAKVRRFFKVGGLFHLSQTEVDTKDETATE